MNKPGSLFKPYSSTFSATEIDDLPIDIQDADSVNVNVVSDEELIIEISDNTRYDNDYNSLQNQPSINNVVLVGNKTAEELGITTSVPVAQSTVLGGIKADPVSIITNSVAAKIHADDKLYVDAVAYQKDQSLTNVQQSTARDNIGTIDKNNEISSYDIYNLF